jgi:hypothetical protein
MKIYYTEGASLRKTDFKFSRSYSRTFHCHYVPTRVRNFKKCDFVVMCNVIFSVLSFMKISQQKMCRMTDSSHNHKYCSPSKTYLTFFLQAWPCIWTKLLGISRHWCKHGNVVVWYIIYLEASRKPLDTPENGEGNRNLFKLNPYWSPLR